MTNKEYEYIIEQQKEIIKQQKDLIDSLMNNLLNNTSIILKEHPFDYKPNAVYYPSANPKISPFTCESTGESHSETTRTSAGYKCTATKGTICDGKCKDCCYHELG